MGATCRKKTSGAKNRHAGFLDLTELKPSPENDRLYAPVDPGDPEVRALADSMKVHGVLEPLVVTADGYVLSGHRRRVAAYLAGLEAVPCRVVEARRVLANGKVDPEFVALLAEHNCQRTKTVEELLREAVVKADPEDSYTALSEYRQARARFDPEDAITIKGTKRRSPITKAKQPMVDAVVRVLEGLRDYWPLSDRQVHYQLLNAPPLRHASKPGSAYTNTGRAYDDLTNLLTRMRLAGVIPMHAIADDTRPVTLLDCHRQVGVFLRREADRMFRGYYRDLMQTQPRHVEIVGEKLTVQSVIKPVALNYAIPLTIARGYCSLAPRAKIADRFRRSGKDGLVILSLSDFDPDGEEITQSLARSLRDDFSISNIECIKVALTAAQIAERRLPPVMTAKESSVHYEKFTAEHGQHVFELEALRPDDLQQVLDNAIRSVIDVDAYNREVAAEKAEAAFLDEKRQRVLAALGPTKAP